jgi:transposase InsO family protein
MRQGDFMATSAMGRSIAKVSRAAPGLTLQVHVVARPCQRQAPGPAHAELVICDQAIDITYIRLRQGFLYLAVVLDVFSRRGVGWAMAEHLRTELVLDALEMAIWNRRPAPGLVHHSDHGCQYTSLAFGRRCRQAGIAVSMGSVGDCFDNALAESFFATLECELIARSRWRTRSEAGMAVFDYIGGFYNPRRRHSALAYLSPAEYERRRPKHVNESLAWNQAATAGASAAGWRFGAGKRVVARK